MAMRIHAAGRLEMLPHLKMLMPVEVSSILAIVCTIILCWDKLHQQRRVM